jgi:hypothetical protein
MRAALAVVLSLYLALIAVAPHAHGLAGGHGAEECAVCVARGGEAASPVVPELAPSALPVGAVAPRPGLAPVTGAPLGAVPGQSPPPAGR